MQQNPTWLCLAFSKGLRDDRQVTDCLSRGTAGGCNDYDDDDVYDDNDDDDDNHEF